MIATEVKTAEELFDLEVLERDYPAAFQTIELPPGWFYCYAMDRARWLDAREVTVEDPYDKVDQIKAEKTLFFTTNFIDKAISSGARVFLTGSTPGRIRNNQPLIEGDLVKGDFDLLVIPQSKKNRFSVTF